jgi:hypothetical protein
MSGKGESGNASAVRGLSIAFSAPVDKRCSVHMGDVHMSLEAVLGFDGKIHVADLGAAAIAEVPPYKALLDRGLARLSAVDGDERQAGGIKDAYG